VPDPELDKDAQIAEDADQGTPGVSDEEGAEEATSDAVPSLSDLLNSDTADEAFLNPLIQSRVQEQVRRAEQRSKDRTLADQRRRFADPEVVAAEMRNVLQRAGADETILDADLLRRGAQNLGAAMRDAAADGLASEIPGFFFSNYKYSEDALAEYHEHLAAGRPDDAFGTLINGAVAQKDTEREESFDARVKTAGAEVAKKELEAVSENGTAPIPATTRGNAASNTRVSLTSAEIARLPGGIWKRLPDDVKTQIEASVSEADTTRGSEVIDMSRLERVAGLAQ